MKVDINQYGVDLWRYTLDALLFRLAICFFIFITSIRDVSTTCDTRSLQDCVHQLSETERLIAAGALRYREYELDEACRRFDDIGVCVRRATRSCQSEDSLKVIKKYWAGVQASFNYMCKEGKSLYLKHQKCYAQINLEFALRTCNRTYELDKEDLNEIAHTTKQVDTHKQLCRITNKLLHCLSQTLEHHCGKEAALWQITAAEKLRQPNMHLYHGCTLAAHRPTIGYMLILLASSLITICSDAMTS